jgi:putative component of toxin-antitoxin plasmid stabilization module
MMITLKNYEKYVEELKDTARARGNCMNTREALKKGICGKAHPCSKWVWCEREKDHKGFCTAVFRGCEVIV